MSIDTVITIGTIVGFIGISVALVSLLNWVCKYPRYRRWSRMHVYPKCPYCNGTKRRMEKVVCMTTNRVLSRFKVHCERCRYDYETFQWWD